MYVGVEQEGGGQEQEALVHPRKQQGARPAYDQYHNCDCPLILSLFENTQLQVNRNFLIRKQGTNCPWEQSIT